MLSPDSRSLYTGAVTPPPGYVFDQAIATTYSLDPDTLLLLSVHLALGQGPSSDQIDPIRLLESLRRLSGRLSVYVDRNGIKIPSENKVLYGLLEPMIEQVEAPRGGVFHPKIWVLRFIQPELDEPPLIRLLVLSRNITYDRSWDISLQLDGRPGGRFIAANRPLGEFLRSLPSIATQKISESAKLRTEKLAEEVRKTVWELPGEFEEVFFHIMGTSRRQWVPPRSKRMAVISPFVTDDALLWLSKQTKDLVAIISRPEEFNRLAPDTLELSGKRFTLDEAAETEDGEELDNRDTLGLHAKAYVVEKGFRTRLYIGSANATTAALIKRSNTEILVELVGRKSRVGDIETLLGEGGLGPVLSDYVPQQESPTPEDEEARARKALEEARDSLAAAELKVVCEADTDAWRLTLVSSKQIVLSGVSQLKAWPITVSEDRALDAYRFNSSQVVELGRFATESVTGLIAFEFVAKINKKISLRMVLNLPVAGFPENRDDAIFRLVLNNKEGFLRYVLLLLSEYAGGFFSGRDIFSRKGTTVSLTDDFSGDTAILEELVRAFSRGPDKLKEVKSIVKRLTSDQTKLSSVPPEFLRLWEVFETAMEEAGK